MILEIFQLKILMIIKITNDVLLIESHSSDKKIQVTNYVQSLKTIYN